MRAKVLTVYLEDTGDQIRVRTETPNFTRDSGFDWDTDSPYMDGYPAAAETIRNHILGCVADINWQAWLQRLNKG